MELPGITMRDVANAAKVSAMTVSLALRNHPSIPDQTRQRIRTLAESLGYRPNPLVATLMTELRTKKRRGAAATIAYITRDLPVHTWVQTTTHAKFFLGAQRRAKSLGYRLEKFNLAEKGMTAERMAGILWQRNIRGIVLAPAPLLTRTEETCWQQFATVLLGFSITGLKGHRVANHHARTMMRVLTELHRCDYRRFGIVLHERENPRVDWSWLAGYDVFFRQDEKCRPIPVLSWNSQGDFDQWFRRWRPDAIATFDTCVADWLRQLGCDVPNEVGVAHLSLHPDECDFSGTDQHCEVIGATAVDVVIEEMHHNHLGVPRHPKTVLIESDWIAGATTRPPTGPA
ncbi:LacI family transcriptional regulator [Opitutaceae bacterium TAV4]|nr:LacI family transcriptional regulator [Opitutaceae bacterium TAV4]RRK02503.1 LacI family transcriptional regulator [Opitutaceae bacterium TAV3]